jgi:hypothetical protein
LHFRSKLTILLKAPHSPPTPRPRTRPTTAKQSFVEQAFAKMAEERKNDPLPIRRPLPNFNDEDSDSVSLSLLLASLSISGPRRDTLASFFP